MHVGHAQLLEIVHAHGQARGVGEARLREGQVLAGILGGGDPVGEVADVDLPDDGVPIGGEAQIEGLVPKALGVRGK